MGQLAHDYSGIVVVRLPFRDRFEAGRLLGGQIRSLVPGSNVVVVALPRGGVSVGFEVAQVLAAPLDIVVVRKLGVPAQPELAMGAICGEVRVLDQELISHLRVSQKEVEEVTRQETFELNRREKLYRARIGALDVRDHTAVLVDDGLATGLTMLAAATHIRKLQAKKLIVAVPVSSDHGCKMLARETDECIALATPEPFSAVGEAYEDFRQVTDAEVEYMLSRSRVTK